MGGGNGEGHLQQYFRFRPRHHPLYYLPVPSQISHGLLYTRIEHGVQNQTNHNNFQQLRVRDYYGKSIIMFEEGYF